MFHAAQRGAFDGNALDILGVDLHHPAKAVGFVGFLGGIKTPIHGGPVLHQFIIAQPKTGVVFGLWPLRRAAAKKQVDVFFPA